MLFQTIVRFLAAFVGSLVAFYLAAHLFHAMGYLNDYELQRVGWMYNQVLEPITSLDWTTQKTALITIAAIAVQALLLGMLFKKWSYRPVKRIDPIVSQERPTGGVVASGERLPTRQIAMYAGIDDVEDADGTEEHMRTPAEERRRLMALLES